MSTSPSAASKLPRRLASRARRPKRRRCQAAGLSVGARALDCSTGHGDGAVGLAIRVERPARTPRADESGRRERGADTSDRVASTAREGSPNGLSILASQWAMTSSSGSI